MKYGFWSILVFVITFLLLVFTKIPFLYFIILVTPLLIIVLTYLSFMYNFRDSLAIQPIPAHGYSARRRELDQAAQEIRILGFHKFDEFYLKTIPDSASYFFRHEQEPAIFCLYHLGKKMTCDLVTRYENLITLTTSNVVDAGMAPRPDKQLLQIFPGKSFMQLLNEHVESHRFILGQGIRTYNLGTNDFRHYFMKSFHEQGTYMSRSFFWPIQLVVRTVLQSGRAYCSSIRQQHAGGKITLFSNSGEQSLHYSD